MMARIRYRWPLSALCTRKSPIQLLLGHRQIIPIITLWVWHEKTVIDIVVRTNFNMLVVGVWLDEVSELKLIFARNLLQLLALIKRVGIIRHYQREKASIFIVKQMKRRVGTEWHKRRQLANI